MKASYLSPREVVAGREEVGGVEADAEAVGEFDQVDDGGEMLGSCSAERSALAGGGDFQAGEDVSVDAIMHDVQSVGHARQAGLFADDHGRAGMCDEIGTAERYASRETSSTK